MFYILEIMARSLNSRCNFENGFFLCDLPEDAVLLVVKVKTKTCNHTLVEDTQKQTEKFRLWKKPTEDGESSPRRLPGILTPRKNNNSIPPTESITPPSLKNLSLEEGTNSNKNKATSWEASVARNVVTTPRASSPYPR